MASEKFERGTQIRREVLGSDYVDRSIQSADDFMRPLLELSTEYCWADVWARDDLPRKTRSLLNIVMLTALNRPTELRTHLRGALSNGCTTEEIRGAILQTAVYCGIPAAIDAARIAKDVIAEHGSA